jgi:hypothetical protein
MKKLIFILAAIAVIASCSSLIRLYLTNNMWINGLVLGVLNTFAMNQYQKYFSRNQTDK